MEKENQRVAISRRLLKEGLLRLLEHKELEKINVSELCKESSINRATFYRHYQTPRDVLKDIERDVSRDLENALGGRLPVQQCTLDEFKDITERICIYLHEHRKLVSTLLRCCTDEDVVRDINEAVWTMAEEIDGFCRLDGESRQLVSTYVGFGSYHLLRQWLMQDSSKTPREIAELVCSITALGKCSLRD